jgi:hypothetical protein
LSERIEKDLQECLNQGLEDEGIRSEPAIRADRLDVIYSQFCFPDYASPWDCKTKLTWVFEVLRAPEPVVSQFEVLGVLILKQ